MHNKMIVEKTMTKSETSEKEHTRKKGDKSITQKHKKHKTISPKLLFFSIHPHNTQSHSQSHHSSSQYHKPFMRMKNR